MKINRCISCENEIEKYPCRYCGFDGDSYRQPGYALPCNHILHGRYLIGRVLGQGGFGMTYVGWDLVLQYKCAIKEYYPNGQALRDCTFGLNMRWSEGEQAESLRRSGMESFLREARKMNRVDHIPEVVRVRDTFIENDTAYIVMEFIEGETLKEKLQRDGVLTWEQARNIFLPAIAAMEKVHQAGLVHRDISPDNIMLEPWGSVKILDLGAAKDLTVNTGASSMQVIKGGFSPIEQYSRNGGSGTWTDVYAMAATMYYSMTGRLPPAAVDRLDADPIKWDLPQLKALPKAVVTALQKALVVSAPKRTQTMALLLKQLEAAPKPKPPKPPKVKQEKPPKPPKEPKPPKPKKEKPPKPPKEPKPPKPKKEKVERKANPKSVRLIAAALAVALLGGAVIALLPKGEEVQLAAPVATTSPVETTVPTEQTTEPTEPPHVHTWSPATVGRPARCESCGLMTGTALPRTINGGGLPLVIKNDGTVMVGSAPKVYEKAFKGIENIVSVCGGFAILEDGTVSVSDEYWLFTYDDWEVKAVSSWKDIVSMEVAGSFLAGLRRDGTVVMACNPNAEYELPDTGDWTDIVAIEAGLGGLIGLKADGTLISSPQRDSNVMSWTDIVSISARGSGVVGLKVDGTVVVRGLSEGDREQVEAWADIVQIDMGNYVVGVKADGTVVTTYGYEDYTKVLAGWKDIVDVSIGGDQYSPVYLGLQSDGTTVSVHTAFQDGYRWSTATDHFRFTDVRVPKAEVLPEKPAPAEQADHVHSWVEATISSPKHCTICGKMEGFPLNNTIAVDPILAVQDGWAKGIVTPLAWGQYTNGFGEMNVQEWRIVRAVVTGWGSSAGVKEDGTVVACGNLPVGTREQVSTWQDIAAVTFLRFDLIGLKKDGTVVVPALGPNTGIAKSVLDEVDVSGWTDIVSIDADISPYWDYGQEPRNNLVGLKSDGTLVITGPGSEPLRAEAESWQNIVGVAAGQNFILGQKPDGTVVAAWDDADAKAEVESWRDIVAIVADGNVAAGLKADGTVVTVVSSATNGYSSFTSDLFPDIASWRDIVSIAVDQSRIVGLKSDGTLVVSQAEGMEDDQLTDVAQISDVRLPG